MDPSTQKMLIAECQPITQQELFFNHEIAYVVSKEWWDNWCSYVGYQKAPSEELPGPIDNSPLMGLSFELFDKGFFLSKKAWKHLCNWYAGGPELPVFIFDGLPDLFPITVYVCFSEDSKPFLVSSQMTVEDLKKHLGSKLLFNYKKMLLQKLESNTLRKDLSGDSTLEEAGIANGSLLVLEETKQLDLPEIPETDDEAGRNTPDRTASTGMS